MSTTLPHRTRALAEALAPYGSDNPQAPHAKVSISLPADLIEVVRAIAVDRRLSVSAVIAASLRRTIEETDQARLDRALELDAEENLAWADAYLPVAGRLLSDVEW